MFNEKINKICARIGTGIITRFRFPILVLVAMLFIFGLLGMDRHRHKHFRTTATGMPALDFQIDRITEKESTKFGLIALAVSVSLMIGLFRNVSGVLGPFLVVTATLVVLYGIMGWLGFPMTMVSTVVSTLILVISISYSIHVINHLQTRFRQTGSRSASIEYAYFHSAWPCFLTALNTTVCPLRANS